MTSEYHDLLESIYRRRRGELIDWLQRQFPRTSHALVQDAVADVFTEALESPDRFRRALDQGGRGELIRMIRVVAWRGLRGHHRRKSTRCELLGQEGVATEPCDPVTPLRVLSGKQELARTLSLVEQAALRFGGTRPNALRAALRARVAGVSDSEAARAHGVPREYVNRAKRWIGAQLRAA